MAEFTSLKMHYSMSQNFLILPYFLKNLLLPVILNLFPPLSLFYPLFLFLLVHNPPNYPLHLYNTNTLPIILHQNLVFPLQPLLLLLLFPNLNLSLNLLIPLPLLPFLAFHLKLLNPLILLNLYSLQHQLNICSFTNFLWKVYLGGKRCLDTLILLDT